MIRIVILIVALVSLVPTTVLSQTSIPAEASGSWSHSNVGQSSTFSTHGDPYVRVKCTRGVVAVKIGRSHVGLVYAGETCEFTILDGEDSIKITSNTFGGSAGTINLPGN